MSKKITEFEQFIVWFSRLEEIPLQSRHDFLEHITKVGHIDEKAENFIASTLGNLEKNSKERQAEWKKYERLVKNAYVIEQTKETSLKYRIAGDIKGWMKEKANWLKFKFQTKESKELKSQESAEDLENAVQIARLKAAL